MYELKKRAQTMGGNAIGVQDLKENKEVTYTNEKLFWIGLQERYKKYMLKNKYVIKRNSRYF